MGFFRVGDLLDITNGRGITAEEIENHPGDLEAVRSGERNNGVMGLIDEAYCRNMGYAYTYGRKVAETLYSDTIIRLPVASDGRVDWRWMEECITSLPYGDRL